MVVGGGGGGGDIPNNACEGSGGGGGGGVGVGQIQLYGGTSYSIVIGAGGKAAYTGGNSNIQGYGVNILVYGGGNGGSGGIGAGGGAWGGSGGGGSGFGGTEPGGSARKGVCTAGCNSLTFYGYPGAKGFQADSGGYGGGAGGNDGFPLYWGPSSDVYGAGGGGGGGGGGLVGGPCCLSGIYGYPGGTYAGFGGDYGKVGGDATKPNSGAGGGGAGCVNGQGGNGASGVVIFAYCGAGTYQSGYSCVSCPAGTKSTAVGLQDISSCAACPAGMYSSPGSTACSYCPEGTFSGPGSATCVLCPEGTYNPSTGSTSIAYCTACPAGTANANSGSTTLANCTACKAGYFSSLPGSSACSPCPAGQFSPSPGATTCKLCPVVAFPTPPGSSACACNPIQDSINLCSLLFQSDITLNSYTASYSNSTDVYGVTQYLLSTLKIEVDINGDGIITRTEITAALGYRSIQSAALASIPVWNNANYTDSVPVERLLNDAITLFTTSPKHTFDGSGANDVLSISATYPNTNWNSDECYQYDSFLNSKYTPVIVSWQYAQSYTNLLSGGLSQVCGYVNGRLIQDFDTSAQLSDGSQTTFQDGGADSDLSFKRVYCLVTLSNDFTTEYQCSLGLFYVRS